jgi:hypothetical protein
MTDPATQQVLKELIEFYGASMDAWLPGNVSGVQLLGAIASNESTFGINCVSKHENSWDQGGKYFQKNLWEIYGSDASCSRSSFQIMYPIAVMEFGLPIEITPQELNHDHIAILYVCRYIKKKVNAGADTLEKILDAYNSGSFLDVQTDKVKAYVAKGVAAYYSVRGLYGLKGGKIAT